MTVMFMTDAGRKTGDSKIDRLAMEYEDKYGQPLTEAQIERLDQLAGSSEYGDYAIDMSGFASDAPFGSPQRESELNAYTKNLQDERNAKRANFTLETLGISPDQNGSFTQPTAPQDSMQGGLGGLGSIFDIMKKQMPPPPTQNRGPILDQGPGKGRRQMPTGPISDNRMPSPTGPFEGGPAPLPTPYEPPVIGRYNPSDDDFSRGQNYTVGTRPDGTPVYRFDPDGMEYLKKSLENEKRNPPVFDRMPVPRAPERPIPPQIPDMMQQLQEALKQKKNREMPQRTPPPMRGDMRKKGLLGGLIEKLEMQAAQKAEQPQMPTRPRTRGGMFRRAEILQNTQPYRGGRFGLDKFRDLNNRSTGGSGGILPRAGGEPDLEQLRKQIRRGINVRGIGI